MSCHQLASSNTSHPWHQSGCSVYTRNQHKLDNTCNPHCKQSIQQLHLPSQQSGSIGKQRLNQPKLPAWRYTNHSPQKMDCTSTWHRIRPIQTWAMVVHQNARTKPHQIHHGLWILSWPQTTTVGSQHSVQPTVMNLLIPGTIST